MLFRLLALIGLITLVGSRFLISSIMAASTLKKIPIVYHHNYNIHLYGLENVLHSFDSKKYGKVFNSLSQKYSLGYSNFHHPPVISQDDLLIVHTEEYLNSLSSSIQIAKITEVPFLAMIPGFVGKWRLLEPMKQAAAGTILASNLALTNGWAINLSGGYHHAKSGNGEGFCVYADIPIAIRKLLNMKSDMTTDLTGDPPKISKALIVDLDAHQGNGYLSAFTSIDPTSKEFSYAKLSNIRIFDMYNGDIYPHDTFAKDFIDYDFPLPSKTSDKKYLSLLREYLPQVLDEDRPDIVFYNAGTDIYERDPLGALSITKAGIIERDEFVFQSCRERNIPIVMVLSGGYTAESAEIISKSIANLIDKKIISLDEFVDMKEASSDKEAKKEKPSKVKKF